MDDRITGAKRRLLERIKRQPGVTSNELADSLGHTAVAVRQHLTVLEQAGLVRQESAAPQGRGRPATLWHLTPLAGESFPDRHADLTLDLIEAAREVFGAEGVEKLVQIRAEKQSAAYTECLAAAGKSLQRRVEALARERTAEGYMAEVTEEEGGSYILVEHHCPICEAAQRCSGLCQAELDVFRGVLGSGARVERTEHLLSDGARCAYRITGA